MRETPTEARLPTKLRQKIQRRTEYVEMASSTATNINNNKFQPHAQPATAPAQQHPSNDQVCALQPGTTPLTLLHVDLNRGLHAAPLLTGVPPGSSYVNVQALVPYHHHHPQATLLPTAPPSLQIASLSTVAPPQMFKPEQRSTATATATTTTTTTTVNEDPLTNSGPSTSGSTQDRVERRLAQNREAARKCRQKKKAYLSRLEAEVQALKTKSAPRDPLSSTTATTTTSKEEKAAALQGATCGSHGSASDGAGSADQQSNSGDLGHLRSRLDRVVWEAVRLRDALSSNAREDALRAQVDALVGRLKELHKEKEKALRTAGLLLIMAGEHLHPPQRVLLWMGGLRPTEGLRLVLEELRAGQLSAALQEQLQRITEDCYQQEEALARAYMALKADILTHLSNRNSPQQQQPWLPLHSAPPLQPPPLPTLTLHNRASTSAAATAAAAHNGAEGDALQLSPQLLGKLSAMRVLLAEAEDLRMSMLGDLQKVLSLPQFAVVLVRPLELLHALNSTSGALQGLQADGRLVL